MKNIYGIQYLRGYAAIIVVLNHLCSTNNSAISSALNFKILGSFGVDIFFIITGFIMAYTLKDFNQYSNRQISISFIKKRFERIYPLHILIIIPSIIIYLHRSYLTHSNPIIANVIGSLLLLPDVTSSSKYKMINHVEWSLVYEMLFYTTLSIFIFFSKSKKIAIISYTICLLLMVFSVNLFGLIGDKQNWVNLKYIIGDTLLLNFTMGFLLFYLLEKIRFNLNIYISTFLLISLTALACLLFNIGVPRVLSFGVPALLIVLLFSSNENINNFKIQPLLTLGAASYAIYLTHPLFETLHFIIESKITIIKNQDVINLLSAAIAITFGVIFHIFIEKKMNSKIRNHLAVKSAA